MLCAYNDKANTTIKIPKPIGNNIQEIIFIFGISMILTILLITNN